MPAAIKVENLSKLYQLGEIGTGTISRDIERWIARIRGKEDPFLKVGQANDRATKGDSDIVYSLRDLNFEIQQGDAVGIIGRNGAGKSTLLKLLSRVTSPTTGKIKINGRVASLLEVGTGFHPELTGRENIYLNGAILGMRKKEIDHKLDEIIDFSSVERYIDTPVKRYSSGMYVRLAFAIAAHLESEILIVDEVLAVGDAEFQKKCLGKMSDVSKGEGRTVLFVSHNMLAVKSLCRNGILLEKGEINIFDHMDIVSQKYLSNYQTASHKLLNQSSGSFTVESIEVNTPSSDGIFPIEKELQLIVKVNSSMAFNLININLFFNTAEGNLIFVTTSEPEPHNAGECLYYCTIPANMLNDNIYSIDIMVVENGEKGILTIKDAIAIEGVESKRNGSWLGKYPGLIKPQFFDWQKKYI
jgi:lipopolysaccharide transport system ATP-binding protein